MSPRRIRRPLLALVVLVAAVAIGYGWKAAHASTPGHPPQHPVTSVAPAEPSTHGAH